MATEIFYPYRTAAGAVALDVSGVPDTVHKRADGSLDVFSDEPDEVVVDLTISVDRFAIETTLPEGRETARYLRILLLTTGLESRRRECHELSGVIDEKDHTLVLRREEWKGEVEVQAVAVLREAQPQGAGFASEKGSRVAWSDPLQILMDESLSPPGRSLEIEWSDFTKDPTLVDQHLFAMATRGDRPPKILLNSAVPGAYEVLSSKGRRGARARIRDAAFHQIAHQGWSSLISAAWSELVDALKDDLDSEDVFADLVEWHSTILRDWAPHLYPGAGDRSSAISQLLEAAAAGHADAVMIQRLPTAIQTRFSTFRGFTGLVRDVAQSTNITAEEQ